MKYTTTLKAGTILRHTYKIERVLGQGGFGITYLAIDTSLDRKVAIKEFFPKDFCDRAGDTSHVTLGTQNTVEIVSKLKAKFLKEAKNIAKFDHPGIIRIISAFEENNTAYYVMDFIEGESLSSMVKRVGNIPEQKALKYIKKVGSALKYMHEKNMSHLDVKPANIMIHQNDDEPILIDFGLSKQYDTEGHQTSTTPAGISHGYAPLEQYRQGGVSEFSPQSDIYSLAATLYKLMTGITPPDATDMVNNRLERNGIINDHIWDAISKAMSISKISRYDNVQDFIKAIDGNNECEQANQNDGTDESTIIQNFSKNEELIETDQKDSYHGVPMREGEIEPEENVDYPEDEEIPIWKKTWFIYTLILVGLICVIWLRFSSGCNRPIIAEGVEDTLITDTIIDEEIAEEYPENTDVPKQDANNKEKDKNNINEEKIIAENKTVKSKNNDEGVVPEKWDNAPKANESNGQINASQGSHSPEVEQTEQAAEFPGGQAGLSRWLSSNLHYPLNAQRNNVQGRVLVKFVIREDGTITNAQIIRGVDGDLDREALRIVYGMPKWKPARKNGVTVSSYYTLPITFKLQ